MFGIFLGCRLAPGGRWNGEYRVADLSDFTELDICENASGQHVHIYEHVTKVVHLSAGGFTLPLMKRYDFINLIVEGLATYAY